MKKGGLSLIPGFISSVSTAASVKILGVAFGFLMTLVLARLIDPADYGVFGASLSLATIVGFAVTRGQHIAILRFYPKLEEERGGAYAANAILFGSKAIFVGSFSLLCAALVAELVVFRLEVFSLKSGLIFWTAVLSVGFGLSEFTSGALRAFGFITYAMAPREVLWRLLVILVVTSLTIVSMVSLSGVEVVAIAGVLLLLTVAVQVPKILSRLNGSNWNEPMEAGHYSEMKKASWGLWGATIVGPTGAHIGTVMVGFVLGPTEAGAYFVADRLAKLLSLALIGVNQIVAPIFSRALANKQIDKLRTTCIYSSLLGLGFSLIGWTIFLGIGRSLLDLFGPTYSQYYDILLILGLGQIVNSAAGPTNIFLYMIGREKRFLAIMAIWTVFGVGFIVPAANEWGLVGVAAVTSLALAGWNVCAVLLSWQSLKKMKLNET